MRDAAADVAAADAAPASPSLVVAPSVAAPCLAAATLRGPGGFILGGLGTHGPEPGLGLVLLPAGAILLLFGIFQVARNTGK